MSDERKPEDDEAAFLEAMSDVKPIEHPRRAVRSTGVERTPGQVQRREDAVSSCKDTVDPNYLTLGEVQPVEPLEFLEWKKDGVQHAVFQKLKQGGYPIQDSLDLHRKYVKDARDLVFGFLARASARDQRSVLISHGKGEASATPARMKSFVKQWLTEHEEVIAFCSAERRHGGVGSVYVLLRKSQESREENRERHGLKSDPDL